MSAELMIDLVRVEVSDKMMDLVREFAIESAKSPKDFQRWWNALDNKKRLFIDGLSSAAALGFNNDLFDMSIFEEEGKKLEEERKVEDYYDSTK